MGAGRGAGHCVAGFSGRQSDQRHCIGRHTGCFRRGQPQRSNGWLCRYAASFRQPGVAGGGQSATRRVGNCSGCSHRAFATAANSSLPIVTTSRRLSPRAPALARPMPTSASTRWSTRAKADLDAARKATAQLAFWLTASLLVGAFCASLAATEGGGLRDGTWGSKVRR